ncbi:hypothetical protein Pla100_60670 [Neorhodopirellula pilleata]|uniref:Uncharacterized protein n=1 Tax=Neorhodopirellula pilleata TaxID=2714738 RepID=A0A5C5ZGI0_9BACT|nr:hypothetical protein Pla100_60670 [Neorhodopirellula pilleata]
MSFALSIDTVQLPNDRAVECVFIDRERQRCFTGGEAGFGGMLQLQVDATDGFGYHAIDGEVVKAPLGQHAAFIVWKVAAVTGDELLAGPHMIEEPDAVNRS